MPDQVPGEVPDGVADEVPGEEGGRLSAFEEIERWAAEARARDAVDARVRERWLRRQDEDQATFEALLVDLAERELAVVVSTMGNRRHIGPIEAVGADFVALRTSGGRTTVVALASVAAVSVAGRGPASGDRDRSSRSVKVTLAEVLAHAVGHRPRVQVHAGQAAIVGELRSVGADVVTLRTDGEPPATAYLSLPSVSEASFLDSG